MKITSVHATAVEVPVTRIAAYSKRTITHVANTIVEVETDAGISGLGEARGTFCARLINERLAPAVVGLPIADCPTQRPASAGHDLRNLPKVTIRSTENEGMLQSERRDPEVVRRYGRALAAELMMQPRVVVRRLLVGQQDGDAWTAQEALEVGCVDRFLIAGRESGAKLAQHDERHGDRTCRPDDINPRGDARA